MVGPGVVVHTYNPIFIREAEMGRSKSKGGPAKSKFLSEK
jgi:hypothetical protein